jgi:uncharacterized RDD family membrane protein YckC
MSAPLPELTVGSVTGIDVSLPVAGAGARAFAFLIDWHIRLLLALAWFCAAALLHNGRLSLAPPDGSDSRWFGAVVAPALASYFLYHYVLELLMRGRTPGKRLAGVRVISRDGSTPGIGALLIRNVFRLIDSLPVFYGVGLITVIATHEHRRVGDIAAGTVLAYENPATPTTSAPPEVSTAYAPRDAVAAELVSELLERWPRLTPEARCHLAMQLLARQGMASESLSGADEATLRAHLERLGAAAAPGVT